MVPSPQNIIIKGPLYAGAIDFGLTFQLLLDLLFVSRVACWWWPRRQAAIYGKNQNNVPTHFVCWNSAIRQWLPICQSIAQSQTRKHEECKRTSKQQALYVPVPRMIIFQTIHADSLCPIPPAGCHIQNCECNRSQYAPTRAARQEINGLN